MRIRRLAGMAVTAAVLAPLLVLTAGTQASAGEQSAAPMPPQVPFEVSQSRYEQCQAMWNVNYWSGGAAFATGQWYACIGG
ncbi:hypothetical protein ABTX81_24825 [Kitasatospora sp. NPDC097605]|uniref:hypothetical protein n=1 Tax=Kitasatospora sp. NPDC097605 TaxID=3157226 RepID=UPI00331E201E